ncbi:MAG: hypothetical protein AAGK37_11045 [Pseudomonadota bacterium]
MTTVTPLSQRAPGVLMWLDGAPIPNAGRYALELEVEERADAASTFRLSLDLTPIATERGTIDWDLLERGEFLASVDGPRIQLLSRVTFGFQMSPDPQVGEPFQAIVFDGYITEIHPYFGEFGVADSRLEVSGIDASVLMHFETVTKTWSNVTDAEIAKEIFAKYGFATDDDSIETPTPERPLERGTLIQRCTDAEFLRLLARRQGFETYVELGAETISPGNHATAASTGHFHRARADLDDVQPPLEFFPRDTPSLISFDARWNAMGPARLRGFRLDETTRLVERTDVTDPGYPRLGTVPRANAIAARLSEIAFPAAETQSAEGSQQAEDLPEGAAAAPNVLESSDICSALTPHDADEMTRITTASFRDADWFVIGEGIVRPERYPAIVRARRPIALSGVGALLNGVWYCQVACHRWARKPDLEQGEESEQVTRRYEVDVTLLRHGLGEAAQLGNGDEPPLASAGESA